MTHLAQWDVLWSAKKFCQHSRKAHKSHKRCKIITQSDRSYRISLKSERAVSKLVMSPCTFATVSLSRVTFSGKWSGRRVKIYPLWTATRWRQIYSLGISQDLPSSRTKHWRDKQRRQIKVWRQCHERVWYESRSEHLQQKINIYLTLSFFN